MSNIYEALEQARQERKDLLSRPMTQGDGEHRTPSGQRAELTVVRTLHHLEREMVPLLQTLAPLLPSSSGGIVQFIASQRGEGVSTIVRELALSAASCLGRRVLILDAAHRNPCQHHFFDVRQKIGWREALERKDGVEQSFHPTTTPNLFLSPTAPVPTLVPQLCSTTVANQLFGELRQRFDLVLIDSSPLSESPESLEMSGLADGVVLVVEAERTHCPAVDNLKRKVERSGGSLLGVVLNKRRYHIPDFIFQML